MKLSEKEFDAIVVGTGPGGATVAKELSENGKKILMLEWGDNEPMKGSFWQFAKNCFIPGKSMFITSNMLGMLRGITTGGSSLHYCGTAFKPPFNMLKPYGVDISNEASEIKDELPIEPLSDELMPQAGKLFLKSATELGYDSRKVDKFIYQKKCKPKCALCDYGCPDGAKWNARFFVDEALKNGSKLITKAKVEKVIIKNKKAVGVQYKYNKETQQAYAPKVIVAAGGIGSPLILRAIGIHGVGYDFFYDPLWFVAGTVPGLTEGRGIPMSAKVHLEEDGIVMTDFNFARLMKASFDLGAFKFRKAFAYNNVLPIMIKVRDELGGRLTNKGWTAKSLTKADKDKLNKGAEHARRILENLGATGIYKTWLFAAHPGGTVKIGEHLDENLKTRYDNLYVCDASVIPEELGLPPTWTILSLGKRLAKHLLHQEKTTGKQDLVQAVSNEEALIEPKPVASVG